MNDFEQDDLIGRERFKKDFGHHYRFQDTDEYNHTDLYMTACTSGCRYSTEIKNRYYSIDEIGDSSILEKIKLDAFKELHRQDKDICLIYFNYYTDGWVAFDMSGRITYLEGLDRQGKMELPATTSVDNGIKEKDVIYLYRINNIYVQDKMKCYDKNM